MKNDTFGSVVRQLRMDRGIGLRELAAKVEISPTYLSQVERDQCPPPVEKNILRIAELLHADPDHLMGLARRVPADVKEILQQRPKQLGDFLRTASTLTDSALEKLIRQAQSLEAKAKKNRKQ